VPSVAGEHLAAQRLADIGALKPDVGVAAATDVLWFYFGYASYFTLTDENGWPLAASSREWSILSKTSVELADHLSEGLQVPVLEDEGLRVVASGGLQVPASAQCDEVNHYTQRWSYQPAARWWELQLTEGGWLLAASLLLITATILLFRRRPA